MSTAEQGDRRGGWGLMAEAVKRRKAGIAIGVAVGLAWTGAKVSIGMIVRSAVDKGIEAGDNGALLRWALLLGVVAACSATFTGLRRYFAFREARWIELDLRDRLFAHVQRLHFGYHDRVQAGELMSRANTDLQQVQAFLVMIPLTISNAVTVVSVTVILAFIDPLLTLLALGSLPFLNVMATRFSRRLSPYVLGIQRESAQLASVVEETVAGVRVIKGLGAESAQAHRLETEADDVYDESIGAARTRAKYVPALELLPNIGLIAVLAYGGHQVIDGSLSLGSLVAFNLYIGMLIWPLRMLGMIVAQGQRALASADRVDEVLSTDPRIVDRPRAVALPAGEGEVRFEQVGFAYGEDGETGAAGGPADAGTGDNGDAGENGTGRASGGGAAHAPGNGAARAPDASAGRASEAGAGGNGAAGGSPRVLDGFDLRIAPGESIALVGATGSGKSTVARLLSRFYDVTEGAVRVDGVDVRDLRLRDLRRSVGIVFEDTFLFSDTIAANIAFADPDTSAEAIERASRLAGAHDFVSRLPEGYRTTIGERGYSLSGGQRQRIAIARAILADPRILVLDDATSAVDPTKEHEIRDALSTVMRGRTTVVIAHRPATIALADRVVLLDRGRVVAEGTHDGLLATESRYREVLAAAAVDEAPDDASGLDAQGGPLHVA